MSKLIGIVGDTGTGKSTSVRHLDPKTTFYVNVASKEMPFRGSAKIYNVAAKNYIEIENPKQIESVLQQVHEKAPHIKSVIIDDANYLMGFTLIKKATEVGFTKFSLMAQDMLNMLMKAKKLRDDLTIFYMCHPEAVMDEEKIISYKMKTSGKAIDTQIKLDGLFSTVLYTYVETDKDGKSTYQFLTNRMGLYPAKSPDGMFEELLIPNNLEIVSQKVNAYYNEEQ
jgi:ABC-type dipeptide/oligopeptide/nickel transport system ATPase component